MKQDYRLYPQATVQDSRHITPENKNQVSFKVRNKIRAPNTKTKSFRQTQAFIFYFILSKLPPCVKSKLSTRTQLAHSRSQTLSSAPKQIRKTRLNHKPEKILIKTKGAALHFHPAIFMAKTSNKL